MALSPVTATGLEPLPISIGTLRVPVISTRVLTRYWLPVAKLSRKRTASWAVVVAVSTRTIVSVTKYLGDMLWTLCFEGIGAWGWWEANPSEFYPLWERVGGQ